MNTGISRGLGKAAILAVAAFGLSACNGAGGGFSFSSSKPDVEGAQIGPVIPHSTSTKLARGAVTVKAPKGFCIDETSVTSGITGSSAMLARCSALNGKGAAASTSAVMTVSVSARRPKPAPVPNVEALEVAVAPAQVLSKRQIGSLALVQVASGGNDVFKPADPKHWRGATSLDTRLILLGLYAPTGAPLAGDAGADALAKLARGISVTRGSIFSFGNQAEKADDSQSANTTSSGTTQAVADVPKAPDGTEKKGLGRVFGRLFNQS